MTGQDSRLSNIGHWIVLDKAGRVVIAWSEENAAVYRDRLDCEVSGPFVRADQLAEAVEERDRLRALLKQAHDRDKWRGEWPTIQWYDDVDRYFKGQVQ